jgi:hypothetical protein
MKRVKRKKMNKHCRKKARAEYVNGISIKWLTEYIDGLDFFIDSDTHSCNYLLSKNIQLNHSVFHF